MFRKKITRFQGVSSPSLLSESEDELPASPVRRWLKICLRTATNPVVILGPFVVAFAALGFLYFQALQAEAAHQSAINAAQSSLAAQPDDPDALRSALSGWTAALEAADALRIQAQFDSRLLSSILDVAELSGVQLASVGLQPDAGVTINENNYLSTPIRLRVRGNLDVIQDFIARLEDGAVVALEVQNAEITFDSTGYTAILRAAVFSQLDDVTGGAN